MSEKKAQAPKEFGRTCQMPKDAPDYLKQKGQCANPELVRVIQANHNATAKQRMRFMTSGQPLLKDNGC